MLDAGTAGGVFGAKVMWGYFREVLDRLRAFAGDSTLSDLGALAAFAPRPRFVWLRRDDLVAQAVSWSRAIQGGRWWSGATEPEAELAFDFEQVDHLVLELETGDASWREWFAANAVEPVQVRYEELVEEPAAAARRVLRRLRIDGEPDPAAVPHERQADELNAAWAARYRELAR